MTVPVHPFTRRHKSRSAVIGVIAVLWTSTQHAQEFAFIADSEYTGSVRARYGVIDQDGNNGEAFSTLLRSAFSTKWHGHWSTVLELDYVARGLSNRHSDGIANNAKPLVPDTAGLDLNQLYLQHHGVSTLWRVGRQRVEYDNQRFVGGNAFWQNEQTFDGLTTQFRFADASLLNYAYVYNVNRIFGEKAGSQLSESDPQYGELNGNRPFARLGDHKLHSHWLRLEWNEWDYQRITGYTYRNEYLDFAAWSHRQTGIRHLFDYKFSTWRLRTQVEYARQWRYQIIEAASTAYELVEAALGFHAFEFAARHEKLEAQKGQTFIAPLGSSHDFHGFVGKFSGTPENGLLEQSFRVSWRQAPWLIELRQLQFDSAQHGIDYGHETDLSVRWRSPTGHSVMLNAGRFWANENSGFNDEWRVFLDYQTEF